MMKDKIPCVTESKVWRNSVSTEVTMVVTQAQEELQNQLYKEVQNIQTSENAVSHVVDERNVPEKDCIEPDNSKKKNDIEPDSDGEKNAVECDSLRGRMMLSLTQIRNEMGQHILWIRSDIVWKVESYLMRLFMKCLAAAMIY